jgi:hypothetical protein
MGWGLYHSIVKTYCHLTILSWQKILAYVVMAFSNAYWSRGESHWDPQLSRGVDRKGSVEEFPVEEN